MPYDPTSDAGYVRLLISDVSDTPVFTDAEIASFITRESSPKRAAARALLTIAANEALLAKKITTQDLTTDGPATAEALRKLAAQLRAEDAEDEATTSGWGLEIVPNWPWSRPPELTGYPYPHA